MTRGRTTSSRVIGAVGGQLVQALSSLSLQVLAAYMLGASGLGLYALLFGVIVSTAAITEGLVGDSLTVLDRHDASVRSALVRWAWLTSVSASAMTTAAFVVTGLLSDWAAVLFLLASVAFMLEGILRRLLMATLRFWSVVGMDSASLSMSLLSLTTFYLLDLGSIEALLAALLLGQLFGMLVGNWLCPRSERTRGSRPAQMGMVWRYGSWRAAQQLVRPTQLSLMRFFIVTQLGAGVAGHLEGARLYIAPVLLVVQGLGSYMFASFSQSRDEHLRSLLSRADRISRRMCATAQGLGIAGALLIPWFGPLITAGKFDISAWDVLAWSAFAAATAANAPYGTLAAVRGYQAIVLKVTVAIAVLVVSVIVVCVLMEVPVAFLPLVLALGLLGQAAIVRQRVLVPATTKAAHTEVSR